MLELRARLRKLALCGLVLALAPACGLDKRDRARVASTNAALTQSLEQSAPELRPFIQEFFDEAAKRGVKLPEWNSYGTFIEDEEIGDTPETESFSARCHQYTDKRFEFRRFWWNRMNPHDQRRVVFHELGHCVLGRGHHDAPRTVLKEHACAHAPVISTYAYPSSIMSSQLQINIAWSIEAWPAYVDELFTRRPVDLSAIELPAERREAIEAEWRKLLEPVLDRFQQEASRFGAKTAPLRLVMGDWSFNHDVNPANESLSLGASVLMNELCARDPGPEKRELAVEPIVFAAIAQAVLPPSKGKFETTSSERGIMPRSLRGMHFSPLDPAFFDEYAAKREDYLKDLFQQ